jgi:CDP-diacylglycerol--glycerol-3-phosphate 3-phosphatidyltransferase
VSPACRPGTAAAAAVVVGVAIVLGCRAIGRVPARGASGEAAAPLLGPRVRAWYLSVLGPLEEQLAAWHVAPDALTFGQLVVSVLAGAAFWTGAIFLAGWLVILAGTLDILDGGVARRTGGASRRGALIDSLVDRWAEFATFVGLGAFFRQTWVLAAVVTAGFGSLMVSYTRARAEGLGLAMDQGHVQRPERYVILGFGAWSSGLVAHLGCAIVGHQTHAVLAAAVIMLAGLSVWTAWQRARHAARALGGTGV